MEDPLAGKALSFLGRPLPESFRLLAVTVPPGGRRGYEAGEWDDALVVVERGEIELECTAGGRRRFERGAVLWLVGLPLRALHNCGSEPVVLTAVSRGRQALGEGSPAPPSRSRPDR